MVGVNTNKPLDSIIVRYQLPHYLCVTVNSLIYSSVKIISIPHYIYHPIKCRYIYIHFFISSGPQAKRLLVVVFGEVGLIEGIVDGCSLVWRCC